MQQPESPVESANNSDAQVAPDSRPAGGDNPDNGKLPIEVPTTIDLVRTQNDELAVLAMSNGGGVPVPRSGTTIAYTVSPT